MTPVRAPLTFALHLLGGATLLAGDGTPLRGPATHRHRLGLLALLADAGQAGLRRDKLVGLLWPERDERAARTLLRVALHELRRIVGAHTIATAGEVLRLDPFVVQSDVAAFESALAAGRLEDAIAAYGGAFLDGFFLDDAEAFDTWALQERRRLERRRDDALAALATQAAERADHATAARWWRTLADHRPESGQAVRGLVDALAAAGDVPGALAAADAHRAHLRAELGVAPEPALVARVAVLRKQTAPVGVDEDAGRAVRPETEAPGREAGDAAPDAIATGLVDSAARGDDMMVPAAPVDRLGRVAIATEPAPATSGRALPARALRRRRWLAAAAGLAIAAAGAAGAILVGRGGPAGDVTTLAVAPFTVVGDAPAALADGLPVLLTLNLDQVAEVRVVPARIALAQSAALAATGGATPARLARALRSDAVLSGVVTRGPGGVEVRATLLGRDGVTLAEAVARGPADDVHALVDQLSLGVLREIWGRRWHVPAPRLAAVGTTSQGALRAYLRGEAFVREALWDSAATALAQAVDFDSTFALAHVRLAEAYGWRTGMNSAPAERALAAAQRFAGRLPPRERALLAVRQLHEAGALAAIDSATALATRYPTDPEAQYMRADVRYHAGWAFGVRFAEATAAMFDTAAALDSLSARVYAHPVSLALERGDSVRFDRAVARLTALGAGSHVQVATHSNYALLRRVRWGAPAAAHAALVEQLRTAPPPAWQTEELLQALEHATLHAPAPAPDLLVDAMARLRATYGDGLPVGLDADGRALAHLAGVGRLTAARRYVDRAWETRPAAVVAVVLMPAVLGYAPAGWVAEQRVRLERPGHSADAPGRRIAAYWRANFALAAGDLPAARAALREAATAVRSPGEPTLSPALATALDAALRGTAGWARLVEGDTAAAIDELAAAERMIGYEDNGIGLFRPLRTLYVRLLARRPDRRTEAIDRIRAEQSRGIGVVWGAWDQELAAALAAEGDAAGAAAARARFAALWARADRPAPP